MTKYEIRAMAAIIICLCVSICMTHFKTVVRVVDTPTISVSTTVNENDIPESDEVISHDGTESVYIDSEIFNTIIDESEKAGVDPGIMLALAWKMSNFDTKYTKVNVGGETANLGLFGLCSKYLDYYAAEFNDGVKFTPYDAKDATHVATMLYSYLLEQCDGDNYKAVTAYSYGLTNSKNINENDFANEVFTYAEKLAAM